MSKPRTKKPQRALPNRPVVIRDAINLQPNETLSDFNMALCRALDEGFDFEGPPGVMEIGDGWLIVATYGYESSAMQYYRFAWSRGADGSFVIDANPVEVAPGYIPVGAAKVEPGRVEVEPAREAARPQDAPRAKRPHVATVALAPLQHAERFAWQDRASAPSGKMDLRDRHSEWSRLDADQAGEYPKASPSGKPFLATFRAGATVLGRVNLNGYLYLPDEVDANIARLQKAIQDAYQHGTDAAPNLALQQLIGEADHPNEDGQRIRATCTVMLDIYRVGEQDVEYVFGVMDVSTGRDIVALADYGYPLATSMRSFADAEMRVMDAKDEFFSRNSDLDGRQYLRMTNLFIAGMDVVVMPASWTYASERLDSTKRELIRDAVARLCGSGPDAAVPPRRAITDATTPNQESEMDFETLKTALTGLTAEQKAEVVALVAPPTDPPAAPTGDALVVAKTALADASKKILEQNATIVAQRAMLDSIETARATAERERAEQERRGKIEDAIKQACEGRTFIDARVPWLRTLLIEDAGKTEADVEAVNARFDAEFATYLDRANPQGPAGKAKTPPVVMDAPQAPVAPPAPPAQDDDPFGGVPFTR